MRSPCCPELCALLSLAAAVGSPRVAAAEAAPRVAVVVETAVNLDHEAQVELGERVAEALRAALVVDVAGGREVDRRLAPMRLPEDCLRDAACQRKVAGILEVDELLALVAVRLGTRLQIEPTWIHVPSGRVVGRDAVVADTVRDDLQDVLRAAAPKLLPDARPRPPPPTQVVVTHHVRTSTPAVAARPPLGTWIAGGVAIAALAAGVGVGAWARAEHQQLVDDGCDSVACDPARIDGVDRRALAADLLFATAAAAAVTGAVLWWLDAPSAPVEAAVVPGAGGATLQLGGRF